MDDAFYARIALESERSGRFFTTTWNGQPNYYADRELDFPDPTPGKALERAAGRPSRLALWDRNKLAEIDRATPPYHTIFECRDWVLLKLE